MRINRHSNGVSHGITGVVLLTHAVGLHARPSVKLTKLAKTFHADISMAAGPEGPWIDAKSIVKVMGAKLAQGSRLHFKAEGSDASDAVAALIGLVERDFEEARADASDS